MTNKPIMTITGRFALLYSDGSMGVMSERQTLEDTRRDAADSDRGETDPVHFTRVARVDIVITEMLGTGHDAPPEEICPYCRRSHATGREHTR